MAKFTKIAVFGASGNFGRPITSALLANSFSVTAISRLGSSAGFPAGVVVIHSDYSVEHLTETLRDLDAAVCVVGTGGISLQVAMIDAAEAAGVKRFIVDDFGWGPDFQGFPEFKDIASSRRIAWDHAKNRSKANSNFTFTGITIGNPIDWALDRFPLFGFDARSRTAIIYDSGKEQFTGTTLEGIGQAVVGVLLHPGETLNRFVKARSIQTCQNELLRAFQSHTCDEWIVRHSTTKELTESGRAKHQAGISGWILELVVAQTLEEGAARGLVARSKDESDADLLGIREEQPEDVVAKVLSNLS